MDQSIRLMTDAERELHIKDCGDLMQAAMVRYEESDNFHDRADADAWRILMERAIKERSPEQVARMESDNFHDRADADAWRILMERAIKERSPEQVARMESEKGFA